MKTNSSAKANKERGFSATPEAPWKDSGAVSMECRTQPNAIFTVIGATPQVGF